jgi:putative ABC transport system permease protein
MNVYQLGKEVSRRFVRYKFKSFLMLLGMLIGVFTLTTGMALAAGFKISVMTYFNNIFLPDSITLATRSGVPNVRPLTEDDVEALVRELPALGAWTPLVPGGAVDLTYNGNSRRAGLTGTGAAAPLATGQGAASGTYISETDVQTRASVVLLGNTVREQLFGSENPVGQRLAIGSQVFQIKGVLDRLGADPHGGDLDNVVMVPYTTLLQMNRWEDLRNIRFRVTSSAEVDATATQMTVLMRARRNLTEGREDDFYITTAPAGQESFGQFEAMFKVLLPVVVGIIFVISLLVIASIMLIGVKERTAEIGLRKAVGARAEEVELQFLAEALLVAVVAGVLGNVLSYPGLLYVQQMYARYGSDDVSFLPDVPLLALSFGCALLTGVLAAWLPARQAAAMSPVTALR